MSLRNSAYIKFIFRDNIPTVKIKSRTSSSLFWWASGACCQEPVHPSSGGPLEPTVKSQLIPFLVGLLSLLSRTSSSLFWWASGACYQKPVRPSSGGPLEPEPVHPSSGGPLEPAVKNQFVPLLVGLWSLLSGPVHPSSGGLWGLLSGPVHPSSGGPLL